MLRAGDDGMLGYSKFIHSNLHRTKNALYEIIKSIVELYEE